VTADRTVDVLIPHFNDVGGLAMSLRSLRRQTGDQTVRAIIADDGSNPESLRDLHELIDGYPLDITLILNGTNRGRPYTRNVLLDAIQSPFTAWFDAGDVWYDYKLEEQFKTFGEGEHDRDDLWVTCNYDWQWTGKRPRRVFQRAQQDQIRGLLVGRDLRAYLWTILAPSNAFRKVGRFDEKLPRLQDLDFFLRFVKEGGTIRSCDDRRALCRYHKSDVGRSAAEIRACNAYIYDKHKELYQGYGLTFRRGRLYEMELLSFRVAMKNRDLPAMAYYASRALMWKPESAVKRFAVALREGRLL
jgi:glycosyltransferase involved in cell wall biosynthesis